MARDQLARQTSPQACTVCPHERCGRCPCVCSPGEHDKPCAVRCEGCGTSGPVELGPEEFCATCKPMPDVTDAERAQALTTTARGNYSCDHPGFTYCGGCVVKIDGEGMLADLREQGWELVRRA